MKLNRTVAQFLLSTLAIYLIATYMPGFSMANTYSAIAFTLLVAFFNFLLWPLLLRWVEGFLVLTFGAGVFLLSTFVMWLATLFIPGVSITWGGLIGAPLVVALASAAIALAAHIEDDEVYARQVHALLKRRAKKGEVITKPGYVFLEIDGLSEETLRTAIARGKMPTLEKWLQKGTHRIRGWETDLSSQTSASQAGILHGCNKDIPAFRWVDKSSGNKIVASNGINDASHIQKRISNGHGLLAGNGSSVANLFSGDSHDNILVYSTIKNLRQVYSESWTAFYSQPFNVAQVIVLFLAEILYELRSRYKQWRKNIQPRLKNRGLSYFFARAGANVLIREVSTYTVIGEILTGEKDVVYTTFLGYDEVAHHCGICDDEAFNVVKGIDTRIRRIDAALELSNRPYQICILSDHGQTNGATFKQRYGLTLDAHVRMLISEEESIYGELNSNQDHFCQIVTAPYHDIKHKLTRGSKAKKLKNAGVIVLASGNLGLIYLTKYPHRLTWEEIDTKYPGLVDGLIKHPGVGFVMLRSEGLGPVALGAKGTYYLATDKVEGENPLAKYDKTAATHLRRTDSFNYIPDILVMSLYDPEHKEVAAFEELIGSHGGLGGGQSKPFIMHPSDWSLGNTEIVGSENVYKLFKAVVNNNKGAPPRDQP